MEASRQSSLRLMGAEFRWPEGKTFEEAHAAGEVEVSSSAICFGRTAYREELEARHLSEYTGRRIADALEKMAYSRAWERAEELDQAPKREARTPTPKED